MLFRFHKPAWLYESLPYLYFGAGLLTMVVLRNAVSVFSGIMLMSAGFMVWNMRRNFRRMKALQQQSSKFAKASRAWSARSEEASELVHLGWSKKYECGHPVIDAQHRKLFASGNALLNAIVGNHAKLDIELQLDELIDELANHFLTEERILAGTAEPITPEHREAHQRLLERSRALSAQFHRDELAASDLFSYIAYDVVVQHVVREDLRFLAHLNPNMPAAPAGT